MSNNTLGGVKATVRAICGDQRKDWLTDDYLDPIVNHIYRLQILYLSDTCTPYITAVRTALNLPVGTNDLAEQQAKADKPFFGLFDPLRDGVDWKAAGAPESTYRPVRWCDKLPDIDPNTESVMATIWCEWRSWVLYITAVAFAIDLRVRGEYIPPPLIKEDDIVTVHPLLGPALAEETAACAMRERSNPGQMQAYELTGTQALDNIANQLVRKQQGTTVRIGRLNRPNARAWRYWNSWPA